MNSPLQPVSEALMRVLNVPSLVGVASPTCAGARRVTDSPPQLSQSAFPYVWYELFSASNRSGLGRGPWLFVLDVRLHTYSTSPGMAEAQRITAEIVRLLRAVETGLLVADWAAPYQPHDGTTLLPFESLGGVKVTELVVENRLFVQEGTPA